MVLIFINKLIYLQIYEFILIIPLTNKEVNECPSLKGKYNHI